jgi:hypothetical protein
MSVDKNKDNKQDANEDNVSIRYNPKIKGAVKFFPLVPIWLFLITIWKSYVALKVYYPDSPVLIVGILVTSFLFLTSFLYILKLNKLEKNE